MTVLSGDHSIIIDAMGGDFAPKEIIEGALGAYNETGANIQLIGNEKIISETVKNNSYEIEGIKVINSTQVVSMQESPSDVLRNKKDSSIYKGTEIASGINNSAFLSAGNTGAVMACSLFNLKRIEGVLRPAIAVVIPLGDSKVVIIDAGANADCKPSYLKQFAIMGRVYCENILKIKEPRTGLLNIGQEDKKGNRLAQESYPILEKSDINFIGNVEGRDIFTGKTDIVVCDGFMGNVLLKTIEGLAKFFFGEIKYILTKNMITKISALGLKKSFIELKDRLDYEEYGGAQLLGLNGVIIISHGSSKAKAIKNAVDVAINGIQTNLTSKIKKEINKE